MSCGVDASRKRGEDAFRLTRRLLDVLPQTSAQTHALIEERKAEANLSSVYYQNIQGIQNLMGTL